LRVQGRKPKNGKEAAPSSPRGKGVFDQVQRRGDQEPRERGQNAHPGTVVVVNECLNLARGKDSVCSTLVKLKLTGRNLGRVYNSKLRHASVYAMQLHT